MTNQRNSSSFGGVRRLALALLLAFALHATPPLVEQARAESRPVPTPTVSVKDAKDADDKKPKDDKKDKGGDGGGVVIQSGDGSSY